MEQQTENREKAVVLLSGGLDSSTVLAIASESGYECYCLSFQYGQRQQVELEKAKAIALQLGAVEHLILSIDLGKIGGSALTENIAVPKNRSVEEMQSSIPQTYVPGRNTIFLAYAMAWAEVIGACHVFIGVNALDYSGYPDCRPEYLKAFEKVAGLATRAGAEQGKALKILAPLQYMTKAAIIKKGLKLGVDYSITHSCYDPGLGGIACGSCDACLLRLKGFAEAGEVDPLPYNNREL